MNHEPTPPPGANPGGLRQPPGTRTMNLVRGVLLGVLVLLAGLSVGSYLWNQRARPSTEAGARAAYYCPMHPSYTSDRPGECPICGMDLEPIPKSALTSDHAGEVRGLAPVRIPPERARLIGVRTARAERRTLGGGIDLVGFVAPDEAWLTQIQLRVAGWVEFLHVNRTGDRVEEGEPLLSLYSPELYQSEQEFLIELRGLRDIGTPQMSHGAGRLDAARERLLLLGVPHDELVRLERDSVASARVVIRSPVRGTVLERGVTQGQYVGADTRLFTVADLSRVWVLADLYEMDVARVRQGDVARFTSEAMPGRVFESRVDFIYPTVSSETRTLKLRLSLANPDRALKPGMFGNVRVARAGAQGLAVPFEAVVHAGDQDYVFRVRDGDHYEPRLVEVGAQDGEWVHIVRGLALGDTVVASASFLIDSESRLKAAIAGMGSQPHGDPGK